MILYPGVVVFINNMQSYRKFQFIVTIAKFLAVTFKKESRLQMMVSVHTTSNGSKNKLLIKIIIIIIIITLLSLNIYKHVCDKYKQTNNYVYGIKKKKKRTNIMNYLCRNNNN